MAVIFSDLDGTFLDPAFAPALDARAFAGVTARWRVIWVSNRTADELVHVQSALGHLDDAIGENGGVIVTRDTARAHALGEPERVGDAWVVHTAEARRATIARVRAAFASAQRRPRLFAELSPDEIAQHSRYSPSDARRAMARRTSVLLMDVDEHDAETAAALDALRRDGCAVESGGRWVSVVHGADKGSAARDWLACEFPFPVPRPLVAAIGNANNDAPLLAMADARFVICEPDGSYAHRLTHIDGVHLLTQRGTAGWLEMLETLAARPEWAA